MATIQKFYLHNAVTTDTGTLPGTSSSFTGTTPNASSGVTSNNFAMDGATGSSQASTSLVTAATTSAQKNWFFRHLSAPLAAQTIASGTWTLSLGASESNANSAFFPTGALIAWRPSAGASVGTIFALAAKTGLATGTMGTAESAVTQTFSGSSLAIQDGDILAFELWGSNTETMATSYTNVAYYGGTTEGSATSNAAYLGAPAALTLYAGTGPATAYPASALIFGC